jgi:hypothetical protein
MLTLKENEVCSQVDNCSFSGIGTDCPCFGTVRERNSKFACELLYLEPVKVCALRPKSQIQIQPQMAA